MNTTKTAKTLTLFGVAAGLGVGLLTAPAHAQDYERVTPRTSAERLAAGTPVKVTLQDALSSETARVGRRVRVQIAGDDSSGLPAGTVFVGRVRAVRPATPHQAGAIDIRFDNGADPDSSAFVPDEASAHLVGQKPTPDHSNYMTYGAGGGALLGLLRAGKLGDAIEGAALGAAGGYAANQATKKSARDVDLKSGDEITLHLDRPISLRTEINAY